MSSQKTLSEIQLFTTTMVQLSLVDAQNFPSTTGVHGGDIEITVNNASKMAVALKNVSYADIYSELQQHRCFNVKMLDGALIAMRYRFARGVIREHSLCYFPCPVLEHFQNEPEVYINDEVYAEVIARNIVAFPIRFDYSDDLSRFVPIDHSYSHLTLGQFKNCRIPVSAPLSPLTFAHFILRNFYNTAFCKYSDKLPARTVSFSSTIEAAERAVPHLVLG